jgi:ribonuclease P protein component
MPNGLTYNRYGLITPKKLGNAVIRNRVRRLLRESLRYQHPHLKPGHDLAILAFAGAVKTPLASPLADLLRQAELFA